MVKLIIILLCSVLFFGCNESSKRPPIATIGIESSHRDFKEVDVVPPGGWFSTPHGTTVWIPEWLEIYQDLKLEALNEIDETTVELDARYPGVVPSDLISNPPDWRVVIMDPGAFSFRGSSTGLATGYVDLGRKIIYVAWRKDNSIEKKLPAFGHELGHVYAFIFSGGDSLFASLYGHGE